MQWNEQILKIEIDAFDKKNTPMLQLPDQVLEHSPIPESILMFLFNQVLPPHPTTVMISFTIE